MKRRLRKHPQHHPSEAGYPEKSSRRLPYGLIWLVLTVLVLVLVIVYDRRSINDAEAHIVSGHELEKKGLFMEALNEYDEALQNKRLGRKAKGGAALSMAEIYYKNLEDYPAAHKYYVQARQIYSPALSADDVQQRAKRASERAEGAGVFQGRSVSGSDGTTTHTIIQRVELMSPPQMNQRGPVVATYKGGEIRAGELYRALEKRPEFLQPDFRENPQKLKDFLNGLMRENLAYEAAVSAGVHKDSDISARLYDYQKALITQRFLVDRREQALVVNNADVEKYYRENIHDYVQPGQISLSLIKSDSETSAAEILQMLRDGQKFEDVASSYSIDMKSAATGGSIGELTEKDTTIPGVGEAPQVIDALFKLPIYSVSEVTPIAGSFFIFKITSVKPARNTTVGEARAKIENILRGRAVDQASRGLGEELTEEFDPKLDEEGLKRFWDFALKQSTTDPATTSTATNTTSSASKTTESVHQP